MRVFESLTGAYMYIVVNQEYRLHLRRRHPEHDCWIRFGKKLADPSLKNNMKTEITNDIETEISLPDYQDSL